MHTHALKKTLSGWDICTQYLVPALVQAGWDLHRQMREQVTFTRGRIIVRGKLHSRGQARRADLTLYRQPNFNSAPARDYFAGSSKQAANLALINMMQSRACDFQLPLLAEWRRIFQNFNGLVKSCDLS